jgi:hypothetical protein
VKDYILFLHHKTSVPIVGKVLEAVKLSVLVGQFFNSIPKEQLILRGFSSATLALQTQSAVFLSGTRVFMSR